MLVVHWSPVKNTKSILRKGIQKSNTGLYCFPLTGDFQLDRWWAKMFQKTRQRTQYNGFVFKVMEGDLPAAFSHWLNGSKKKIQSLEELSVAYRDTILWRIAERYSGLGYDGQTSDSEMLEIASELVNQTPQLYTRVLTGEPDFLEYIFEDYQIVLSHSIPAKRISKVITLSSDPGRERKKQFREITSNSDIRTY